LSVVGLVLLDRSVHGPVTGDDHQRYHDRVFRVVRVVDGDTFDIDIPDADKPTTRVRLWGVDTPEVAKSGGTGRGRDGGASPTKGMHFGVEASAFARETLLGEDVRIVLAPDRTRGLYGRLLAYAFIDRDGPMFNELLLERGYAYADLRFEHVYKRQFKAIEKRARRNGIGLWRDVTPGEMPEWKQRFERFLEGK